MLSLVFLIQLIHAQRSFTQPVASKFRFPDESSRDQSLPLLAFNRTSSFFLPITDTGPANVLVYDAQPKKFFTYDFKKQTFVDVGDMNPLGGDITTDMCKATSINDNFTIVCRLNHDTAPFDMHVFRFQYASDSVKLIDISLLSGGRFLTAEDELVDVATDQTRVVIGTNVGLFAADHVRQNVVSDLYPLQVENWAVPVERVNIFGNDDGTSQIVISNKNGFNVTAPYTSRDVPLQLKWSWHWLFGVTDGPIASADLVNGKTLFADHGSLQLRYQDGSMWRMGQVKQGLPVVNLTSVVIAKEGKQSEQSLTDIELNDQGAMYWIGSDNGLGFFNQADASFPWRFFSGYRWLVGDYVDELFLADKGGVFALTDQGISVILLEQWTLDQKAGEIKKVYESGRHGRMDRGKDHPMNGLVSNIGLHGFGNLEQFGQGASDNEGLWTAMFAAGECFRFAATGEQQAADNAMKLYWGVELLKNLTGVEGLISRSVAENDQNDPARWILWNTTSEIECFECEGLYWKNDVSQDSIIGHMYFMPIFAELVGSALDDNQNAQYRAVEAYLSIVNRIVENDYQLPDWNGERTKWGFWNPAELNDNPDRYSERGLNSLQLITYLATAEALCDQYKLEKKHEYISDHLIPLFTEHNYRENILNVKMTCPCDDNFSDDEQAFLTYYLFYFTMKNHMHLLPVEVTQTMADSMYRHWKYTSRSGSSAFGAVFAAFYPSLSEKDSAFTMDIVRRDLERMPLSQIDWPCDNSHRHDIFRDPFVDRWDKFNTRSTTPFYKDEMAYLQWNGDPFFLTSGSGGAEYPGTIFTLPYWTARYHQLLE